MKEMAPNRKREKKWSVAETEKRRVMESRPRRVVFRAVQSPWTAFASEDLKSELMD